MALCQICNDPFAPTRRDQRYCSNACRMVAYRLRRRPFDRGPKVCPQCGQVFQGNGWDGIDTHWRANHESIMPTAFVLEYILFASAFVEQDVTRRPGR